MNIQQIQKTMGNKITSISKNVDADYWTIRNNMKEQSPEETAIELKEMGIKVLGVDVAIGFIFVRG
jgi:hypothetical protein